MVPPLLLAALLALAAAGTAPGAAAPQGLRVCNETAHPVRVALGHHNGEGWRSQGWWRIPARSCMTLIDEPLIARFYYLFGRHEGAGGGWDDNRYFCLGQGDRWVVEGRGQCEARGHQSAGFFEVDTGEEPGWTQYLSD